MSIANIPFTNWLFYTIGLLLLLPMATQIRYYRVTKSADFIIFAGVFLNASVSSLISLPSFFVDPVFDYFFLLIQRIAFVNTYFLLIVLIIRMVRIKTLNRWFFSNVSFGVLFYIIVTLEFLVRTDEIRLGVSTIGESYRLVSGVLMLAVSYSQKPIVVNRSVLNSLRVWRIAGIAQILAPVFMISGHVIYINANLTITPLQAFLFTIYSFLILMFVIAAFVLALYYPQFLLFSHAQLIRASDLYQKLKSEETDVSSQSVILGYLRSIPQELFQEIIITH